MLADRRADSLSTHFAAQWLRLTGLADVHPEPTIFPDFTRNLATSMRREVELGFDHIVREDRPLTELLTADYTFVNEVLAKHYGIPNVAGPHFRKVTLTDPNRFGLLGRGAILTQTSLANRTSPVARGKYVLEVLMGAPPPLPPPNVPPLAETVEQRGRAHGARTHGGASHQRHLRGLPQDHGPDRPGARELRRHRQVAHQGRTAPGGPARRHVRRPSARWPGQPARTLWSATPTPSARASPRAC